MEMPGRGLSVRDIEDAVEDETGRLLLSKTAVSEIGKQLWADCQRFVRRDLAFHRSYAGAASGLPLGYVASTTTTFLHPPNTGSLINAGITGMILSLSRKRGP